MSERESRRPVRAPAGAAVAWRLDGAGTGPRAPLVLCLHGHGMDEDFFAVLLSGLFELPARFLIPRAPSPAAPGPGVRHPASWYPYDGNQERFRRELERVEGELVALLATVEREQGLAPASRVLLGFSQGGYCGSWTALRRADLFDGMVVVGARVKTEWLAAEMRAAAARGFRALLCHGARDRSVAPAASERSRAALAEAGVDVELRTFEAGHSLGRAKVRAIADWLAAAFAPGAAS